MRWVKTCARQACAEKEILNTDLRYALAYSPAQMDMGKMDPITSIKVVRQQYGVISSCMWWRTRFSCASYRSNRPATYPPSTDQKKWCKMLPSRKCSIFFTAELAGERVQNNINTKQCNNNFEKTEVIAEKNTACNEHESAITKCSCATVTLELPPLPTSECAPSYETTRDKYPAVFF